MSKVQRGQPNVFNAVANEVKSLEKDLAHELKSLAHARTHEPKPAPKADAPGAKKPVDGFEKAHATQAQPSHAPAALHPPQVDRQCTPAEVKQIEAALAQQQAHKALSQSGQQMPLAQAAQPRALAQAAAPQGFANLVWKSDRPGMGAVTYDGGTMFRVWAPNADQVFVAGDFNGWMPTELGNEYNGNFSSDFAGAHGGQQYRFLIRKGNDWFWRTDPRAQQVTNSTGNAIIHDPTWYQWQHDWDFKMPPKNQTVTYEMHIGTYDDSPGFGPGNWNSAIAKLDHLKGMGINMIEVMPSSEFPGDFSWGYNPADPFAPESAYGSPEDMKHFIDECHARGIGVTLDVVYNHFGPSDLNGLWDFDGQSYGNGGIYFYNDSRGQTPWGPRPNFGRKEVQDYIYDNAMMWLREYHVDGLRLDATKEIRSANGQDNPDGWNVLKRINDTVNREMPWKRIIAEDMDNNPAITNPNGAGFDQQWDPDFFHKIDDQVLKLNDSERDMNVVKDAILHNIDGDPFSRIIYTQSHDEVANGKQYLESMVDPGNPGSYWAKKKQTLAAAIALTSAGSPMLFQGQEFNQAGSFSAENPLDWNNANWFGGINQMYTDLIHLRRNWNDNTQGLSGANTHVFHVNNNDKVIAYQRWDQGGNGDDTIVIANFGDKTLNNYSLGLPSDGTWKVRFNSDAKVYSPDFGSTPVFDVGAQWGGEDGLPAHGTINIPPYSVIILSKDR